MNTAGGNEKISEQIRILLNQNEDIKRSVCSQDEGFLEMFVRNGRIQKILYQHDVVVTNALEHIMDQLDADIENTPSPNVIPDHVYRRFVYMLATATLAIAEMDYGHLKFQFNFVNTGADWSENLKCTVVKELHIPNKESQ